MVTTAYIILTSDCLAFTEYTRGHVFYCVRWDVGETS